MGRPLNFRVWAKASSPAVFVGVFEDPAGMPACVFADPRSGRAIGPLNLRLGRKTGYTAPAPRVGAPPRAEPGRLGLLEYYRIEWNGQRRGPDAEERGVFLRFEPGPESRDLAALAVDGLLLGLLAKDAALTEPREIERAQWGLILARAGAAAERHLAHVKKRAPEAWPELRDVTELVFDRKPPRSRSLKDFEVVEPGVLQPRAWHNPEACVEPDPGPFAPGPRDPLRFLRAAGADVYRAALKTLENASERADVLALGLDAGGRLAVATPATELLRWCSPEAPPRFGDILRLTLQDDRVAWAEIAGNDPAKAVDLLRAEGSTRSKALLGLATWEGWDVGRIPEALSVNPSIEHARRIEPRLPGEGTSREKLRAVLSVVAAYWRAEAFEDAWILLGRMPSLLPETKDSAVLRAARYLHRLLEARHVHDATEEARDELSNVWDGTLSLIAEEIGMSGRCLEVLENAGL